MKIFYKTQPNINSWQQPTRQCRRVNGFTLVEVMVSVVLLTISMLGLAALQNSGTRFDHRAYLRSQSVIQTADMLDRMRANQAGAYAGYYTSVATPLVSTKDCSVSTNNCTSQELATHDLIEWNTANAVTFPRGNGDVVDNVVVGGGDFTISVFWVEQSQEREIGGSYQNPCDGGTNENLHCNQVEVRL